MKNLRNISKISAIAFVLLLSFSAIFIAFPLVSAHEPPWTVGTFAFLSVEPNPVGVGQTAYIGMWVDKEVPTAIGREWGAHWHNFTVNVTKPNGEKEVLGPFSSDAVGGAWTAFVPDQLGDYEFVFSFPGQVLVEENPYPFPSFFPRGEEFVNDTFTGSTSDVVTLTVQQDQIETAYPPNPFPTEYWERPINSMNRNWYPLGGNWLGLGATQFGYSGLYGPTSGENFNPYTTAPGSGHVLWTKPIAFGGQIGGEFGDSETSLYSTGTAYEAKFSAVILYGILYYQEFPGAANNPGDLKAVDLRTGEELWSEPLPSEQTLRVGMVYNMITGDQYGGHAYLFTQTGGGFGFGFILPTQPTKWSMYEAKTGDWILDIANASAGTLVEGPNGEILSYSASGGMLKLWNASKCVEEGSWIQGYMVYSPAEIWRPPQGATIDWNGGYEWSVPIATNLDGVPLNLGIQKVADGVVVLSQFPGGGRSRDNPGWRVDAGYSATTGELLWGPINRTTTAWAYLPFGPAGEGVYTDYDEQEMLWNAYNLTTGEKLWGQTESPTDVAWTYYDRANGVIGYGNLYQWTFGGEVFAYDLQTGDMKWSWSAGSAGTDTPYGVWPLGTFNSKYLLADGKLYVRAGHDYTPPVFKGAKLYALNATTGDEIWSSLSFSVVGSPAVADGIMVWYNGYDNQIYSYGKGPSKTTVTAPESAQPLGTKVLIQGSITDESPGTKTSLLTSRFPNGVPAMSDADQSAWMEYLYQQQPMPADVQGVTVKLYAVDPNGNYQDIGTTTTDMWGNFGKSWNPPVEGDYLVVADFGGTESYYGSSSSTYITVGPAPTPGQPIETEEPSTAPPTTEEPSTAAPTTEGPTGEVGPASVITTEVIIIAAVGVAAIIGVGAYWVLRRRK